MKTTFRISIMLGMLLFIPCLFSSGQVSVTPDNTPPHPSSMLEVKSTDRGILIPRMTKAQRLSIVSPANGLMIYQIWSGDVNGDGFYYYNGTTWTRIGEHSGHYIGEPYAGGIVLWLDETGKHGLICSVADLSISQVWSNINNVLIGSTAQSAWAGLGNTMAIVNQSQHVSSAAQLCLNYVNVDNGTGTFNDWYLPSIGEARHLTNNIYQVQKALETDGNPTTTPISDGLYWTSNEDDTTHAWVFKWSQQYPDSFRVKSATHYVRAVRAF
jgi:hypothetical protein